MVITPLTSLRSTIAVTVATAALVLTGCGSIPISAFTDEGETSPVQLCDKDSANCVETTVARVIDGDTVDVHTDVDEVRRVRVLGIDTPETKHPDKPVGCMGPEASATTTDLLPEGHPVIVVTDPAADSEDNYGRQLAHLVTETGDNLGEELLSQGLAETTSFPHSLSGHYADLETTARYDGHGLWAQC